MEKPSYQVRLEVFTGPLDLLLNLIEQEQLDITTISLARITDQYLAYLHMVQERHPDDLADFVVIAARLLLIKSRALLPRPLQAIEEEEDVGEDLVRQLREYKRFRQIAEILRQREEDGLHMYERAVPTSKVLNLEPRVDLRDTSLEDLIEALRAMLRDQVETDDQLDVVPYTVTISQKMERIRALIRARRRLAFDDLIDDSGSRIEIIVTLLAVLELIRAGHISAWQDGLFGPISIAALDGDRTSLGESSEASASFA
jgi:segregation and condensation protein A